MAMSNVEVTRREIEAKLSSVGDYVKMDYLQACLKKQLDFDTRKFVMLSLAALYENKGMLAEAGRLIRASADINTTFEKKIEEFLKSIDMFVKAGNFDEAEVSYNKAVASANERQKTDIKAKQIMIYKRQAQVLLQRDKRKPAADLYERFLTLPDLKQEDKFEATEKLLDLYQKLGKVKEYYALKRRINPLG